MTSLKYGIDIGIYMWRLIYYTEDGRTNEIRLNDSTDNITNAFFEGTSKSLRKRKIDIELQPTERHGKL